MIEVLFKNMDTSPALRSYVRNQIKEIIFSHPRPALWRTRAVIQMHNSPAQPGRDYYTMKIFASANRHHPVVVEKGGTTIQVAVQNTLQAFSISVNRFTDKLLKLNREKVRRFENQFQI